MLVVFVFIVGVITNAYWFMGLTMIVPSNGYITPQCRLLCDDPICNAICEPVCNVSCSYQCVDESRICDQPICRQRCPDDQVVADACPACETVCDPLYCYGGNAGCSPICEAISCNWACRKPLDSECPKQTCEWQCERPACEYPRDYFTSMASIPLPPTLFILMLVFFWAM